MSHTKLKASDIIELWDTWDTEKHRTANIGTRYGMKRKKHLYIPAATRRQPGALPERAC